VVLYPPAAYAAAVHDQHVLPQCHGQVEVRQPRQVALEACRGGGRPWMNGRGLGRSKGVIQGASRESKDLAGLDTRCVQAVNRPGRPGRPGYQQVLARLQMTTGPATGAAPGRYSLTDTVPTCCMHAAGPARAPHMSAALASA
jgi:hypothetical protein